jgi:DNA-binding transcriptional LysR family regulator
MQLDLEPDLLRSFLAVAETESFTQAAGRLNRVQSAVSSQIMKLEDIVGQKLFARGRGRGVALTPAGDSLIGYARRILALNAEALAELGPKALSGPLSLGTTDTYAQCYLPPVLTLFAQANPKVQLEVRSAASRALLAALDSGALDLALVTRQPDRDDGLLLRREALVWVAARGHEPQKKDPLPLAFMPQGCAFRATGLPALDRSGRAWRMAFSSEGPAGVRAAVTAGLAVTVLPRSTLGPALEDLTGSAGFPALPSIDIMIHWRAGAAPPALTRLVDDIFAELGSAGAQRAWPPSG